MTKKDKLIRLAFDGCCKALDLNEFYLQFNSMNEYKTIKAFIESIRDTYTEDIKRMISERYKEYCSKNPLPEFLKGTSLDTGRFLI